MARDARSHILTVSYDGDGNFPSGLSDPVASPVLGARRILTTGATLEIAPDSSPWPAAPSPYRPPAHELGHHGPRGAAQVLSFNPRPPRSRIKRLGISRSPG